MRRTNTRDNLSLMTSSCASGVCLSWWGNTKGAPLPTNSHQGSSRCVPAAGCSINIQGRRGHGMVYAATTDYQVKPCGSLHAKITGYFTRKIRSNVSGKSRVEMARGKSGAHSSQQSSTSQNLSGSERIRSGLVQEGWRFREISREIRQSSPSGNRIRRKSCGSIFYRWCRRTSLQCFSACTKAAGLPELPQL